jgi:hypothetical protein
MARGGELDGEDGMNRSLAGWNVAGEVRIAMIEMRSISKRRREKSSIKKMTYEGKLDKDAELPWSLDKR